MENNDQMHTLQSKIKSITRAGASPEKDLTFTYDPMGNRLSKKIITPEGNKNRGFKKNLPVKYESVILRGQFARVAELVDALDSKSSSGNGVRVRFPPRVPGEVKCFALTLIKSRETPSRLFSFLSPPYRNGRPIGYG